MLILKQNHTEYQLTIRCRFGKSTALERDRSNGFAVGLPGGAGLRQVCSRVVLDGFAVDNGTIGGFAMGYLSLAT